ncbi:unnamed protein product [Linum trigynum]|uniref:Uncharacterized protein n=1 Tax=Linum trigynum TaxID=586398 RepID=A0AAV2ED42_9ROSI
MDEIPSPSQQLPISTTTKTIKEKQLTLIPLIFLIYFEVAGKEPAAPLSSPAAIIFMSPPPRGQDSSLPPSFLIPIFFQI